MKLVNFSFLVLCVFISNISLAASEKFIKIDDCILQYESNTQSGKYLGYLNLKSVNDLHIYKDGSVRIYSGGVVVVIPEDKSIHVNSDENRVLLLRKYSSCNK